MLAGWPTEGDIADSLPMLRGTRAAGSPDLGGCLRHWRVSRREVQETGVRVTELGNGHIKALIV